MKAPLLMPLVRLLPHLGRLGRASRWRRTKGLPRVWAHRGDSAHEPENTMVAFDRARSVGADGIELDVRLDRDGTVVVFHDDTLDRLCGRPGRIEELSAIERQTLRVGGQPIPTLAEVLHAFPDLEINVEIKAPRPLRAQALVSATAQVIAGGGRADQILVSSFDPTALVQLHMISPDVSTAYLMSDDQSFVVRNGWVGRLTGVSVFHPSHALCTVATVQRWHLAGIPLNVWTVDDPAELARLAKLGVDGVFTNDPARARAVLGALQGC